MTERWEKNNTTRYLSVSQAVSKYLVSMQFLTSQMPKCVHRSKNYDRMIDYALESVQRRVDTRQTTRTTLDTVCGGHRRRHTAI